MVGKEQICRHALGIKGVVGIGVGYCNPENKKLGAGIVLYVDKNFKSIKSKDLSQIKISIHGKRYLVPLRIVKKREDSGKRSSIRTKSPTSHCGV